MTETKIMFKGIECFFSNKADDIVPSNEAKNGLLESFFSYLPINDMKWLDCKVLDEAYNGDGLVEIYSITNGTDELLFWPSVHKSNLLIRIECTGERKDLQRISTVNL